MVTKPTKRSRPAGISLGAIRGTGATASRKARRHVHLISGFLDKPMADFYLVMGLTLGLVTFGLVMMASASAVDSIQTHGSAYYLFTKQLVFVAGGIAAMIAAMRIPLHRWRKLSPMLMIATIALLVLVLIPGVGMELYGARRWFNIGGFFSLQPSEIGKIAFLLWGAHVLVQRRKVLNTWEGMLKPLVPGLVLLCGLVIVEPDLHTTITYLIIFLALLWIVGAPFRLFGIMLSGVLSVGVIAIATQGFRMTRLLAFLDPWSDAQDTGHQAIQGFYALATGGLFGVGLGNSRTKWGALPNAHSDYIFAIIGEELGFAGCVLVLALFIGLGFAGFRIARRTSDLFIRLVAGSIAVWMVAQAVINIGYVVGLLPVTGITLPLISSGGTSIVVTMFAMGILGSCARHEPAAVRHLQSRARRFGKWLSLPVPASAVLPNEKPAPAAHRSTERPTHSKPAKAPARAAKSTTAKSTARAIPGRTSTSRAAATRTPTTRTTSGRTTAGSASSRASAAGRITPAPRRDYGGDDRYRESRGRRAG